MAFPSDPRGRIGRNKYWIMFLVNIVTVFVLILGAFGALAAGMFPLAIVLFLAIAPVGIYFRVVMMRRCRDIGWPAILPWLFFGAGMLASFGSFGEIGSTTATLSALGFQMLVGMADFVFMIVIGCIAGQSEGRADYETIFGPDERDRPVSAPTRMTKPAYRGEVVDERDEDRDARWDAAIQNALAAHKGTPAPASPPRPPIALQPGGFGRKPVC
jgi:uncharacterized membrane protein YhaH (DUF805 family)